MAGMSSRRCCHAAVAVEYAKLHRFAFPVMLFLLVVLPMIAPGANVVARVVGPIADAIVRGLLALAGVLT